MHDSDTAPTTTSRFATAVRNPFVLIPAAAAIVSLLLRYAPTAWYTQAAAVVTLAAALMWFRRAEAFFRRLATGLATAAAGTTAIFSLSARYQWGPEAFVAFATDNGSIVTASFTAGAVLFGLFELVRVVKASPSEETIDLILRRYERTVAEKDTAIDGMQSELSKTKGEIDTLRKALARAEKMSIAGDPEAKAAIDEARRSGDIELMQNRLIKEADRQEAEIKAKMAEMATDYIELCREIAETAYIRGDWSEARIRLDSIIRIDGDDLDAINRLGHINEGQGRLDQAEDNYKEVLAKCGDDLSWQAAANGNLGLIYRTRGDLDMAEEFLRKSLDIDEHLGRREGMANQYGNLGLIYRTRGDLDKAEEFLRKALDIDEQLGRREGLAAEYGNLGLIYQTRGDLDKAEEFHSKSLDIEKQLGRREGMANQYGNLGLIFQTRGQLDKAEEFHRKSLDIEKQLGRREGMANQYGNLGLIYQIRCDLDKAEEFLRKALDINRQLGRREGMATQYGNLGLIYQTRGDLDKAEEFLRKSLDIDKRLGRREGMANQYGNLGLIYQTRGDLEKAEEFLRKALDIDERLGRREGMANQYGNLGLIYRTRGDLGKAEEFLRKSLDINEQLGQREGIANQYGNLGNVYHDRNDIKTCRDYWRTARDMYREAQMPHMVEQMQSWLDDLPPDDD